MASLEQLLASLSLEKFLPKFQEEEIDLDAARQLNDEELKGLGLPLGPRKKLLEAFHSTSSPAATTSNSKASSAPKSNGPSPSTALKDVGMFQWLFEGERCYGDDRPTSMTRTWHPTGEPDSTSSRNQFISVSPKGIISWHLESGQSVWKIKPAETVYAVDANVGKNILVAAGGTRHTSFIDVYDLSTNSLKGSLKQPNGLSEAFYEVCLLTHAGSPQAIVEDYSGVTRKLHIFDIDAGKRISTVETEIRGSPRIIQDPFNPGVFWSRRLRQTMPMAARFPSSMHESSPLHPCDLLWD